MEENGQRLSKKTVKFVNGHAKLKISLDEDLTAKNNPRHDWTKSLGISGNITVISEERKQSNVLSFCCKFFENEDGNIQEEQIDWVHDVGP